ncbi:MAG: bifunctional (p)ppGpp synthetase/guanosine-3',5'-bis(diphosphate) 3'-pyrophosphohydrolase [Deltaproteobacteria bacterium]|nr:bifunctional (p)ppGpp synthetase/guanosine-3',5'-bis(diphosphate) 3'-pyrophosphohydrolase [Deltaproteobacteria bacterium]
MIRLHDILDAVAAYIPDADLEPIQKAYIFSAKSHKGQTRRSGEPYLIHPMEVAWILTQMKLDVASVATGLLHDTVEDTVATLEEVEALFGEEIREMVDGITKLGKIRFQTTEEKQAENFRKMIMAMAKDIRVIFVKLADRLHNMRTLSHLLEPKRVEIAQETLDIYAPIANRLGIQQMKVELEDLALKYLKPDVFHMIEERIAKRKVHRDHFMQEVREIAQRELAKHQLSCEIVGRTKHLFSIHRKMEAQNIPFDEVHDLVAFRIMVGTLSECYEALGILHALWKPVPGRFKDYIAMPKQNNYRSLHTTVVGPHGERCEFQIRTREMHDIAERGIAAHWRYKERGRKIDQQDEMKFKWVRQLLQWQRELDEPAEFLDTIKLDLFADDIYVFTPNGELKELPRGATPIDFAYDIHTDVGHACVGARVNGRIIPLRYQLHSGDTVEIITGKQKRPNKDWLQFVRTSRAKAKIRHYLRHEEREQAEAIGRELLDKAGHRVGVSAAKILKSKEVASFMVQHGIKDVEGLLATIGYGKMTTDEVLALVIPREEWQQAESVPAPASKMSRLVGKITRRSHSPVKISGISDVLVHFGKCCNPVPGDSIVGFVTRGRGVSIHTIDCARVLASDPARCLPVEWNVEAGAVRIAKIRISCVDRPGLLAKMTEAITEQEVNIVEASIRTMEDQKAVNVFSIEISDLNQLRQVIHALEKVKGVIAVERVRG